MSPREIVFNVLSVIILLLLVASISSLVYIIVLLVKKKFTLKKLVPLISFIVLLIALSIWQEELQRQIMIGQFNNEFLPVVEQMKNHLQGLLK